MDIRECRTQEERAATYRVLRQLYDIPQERYLSHLAEMTETGYRLIGAFEGAGCAGATGFRTGRRFYCGRYLHIENMVVDEARRAQGVARAMLAWLKQEAARIGCDCLLADTYVDNATAHKFFLREGFHIRGFHLKCDIG